MIKPSLSKCPVCKSKLKKKLIEYFCKEKHYSVFKIDFKNKFSRYEECIKSFDLKFSVINFIHFNPDIPNYSDILFYSDSGNNSIEDINRIFRCGSYLEWEKEVKEYYQNHQLLK